MYQHIKVPAQGQKITVNADNSLNVPDEPVIPFIEGDGTGADITPVMLKVVDAAVAKAYGGKKKIHWMEVYAGEKSTKVYGPDVWLPEETLHAVRGQGGRGDAVGPGRQTAAAGGEELLHQRAGPRRAPPVDDQVGTGGAGGTGENQFDPVSKRGRPPGIPGDEA